MSSVFLVLLSREGGLLSIGSGSFVLWQVLLFKRILTKTT